MRSEACFGNAEAVGPKGWASHRVCKARAGIRSSGAAQFRRVQVLAGWMPVRIPASLIKI